jgi:hypothetical protein
MQILSCVEASTVDTLNKEVCTVSTCLLIYAFVRRKYFQHCDRRHNNSGSRHKHYSEIAWESIQLGK